MQLYIDLRNKPLYSNCLYITMLCICKKYLSVFSYENDKLLLSSFIWGYQNDKLLLSSVIWGYHVQHKLYMGITHLSIFYSNDNRVVYLQFHKTNSQKLQYCRLLRQYKTNTLNGTFFFENQICWIIRI